MNSSVIELNELNFTEEVLDAEEPVLVEFWAEWSDSSRQIAPLIESVASDRAGEVKVAAVDVEHHEQLARQYGVRAVPTLLFFNHGNLWHQIVGRTSDREVRSALDRLT